MAGQKVTISEFKIKVRLDSGSAFKGLQRLENKLKTFQDYMKKSFAAERANLSNLRNRIQGQEKLNAGVKKYNTHTKKLNQNLQSTRGSVLAISSAPWKGLTAALLTFISIRGVVSAIADRFQIMMRSGMAIEQSMASLDAAIAGSEIGGNLSTKNLEKLQQQQRDFTLRMAKTMGLNFAETTSDYAKFFAASSTYIGADGSQKLFESLAKLGVVYGISSEKMQRATMAFTQMASKNQVMAEELKQQLGDVLPGSMEIFARAATKMGKFGEVSIAKLYDLMAGGKLVAAEILPYVSDEMLRLANAGGAFDKMMATAGQRFKIFTSQLQLFYKGAYNQFSDTLAGIFDKLTAILDSHLLQGAVGGFFDWFLGYLSEGLDWFLETFVKPFEEKFLSAKTFEERKAVIKDFFLSIASYIKDTLLPDNMFDFGKMVGEGIEKALNYINFENLNTFKDNFVDFLTDIFYKVFNGITGFSLGVDEGLKEQSWWDKAKMHFADLAYAVPPGMIDPSLNKSQYSKPKEEEESKITLNIHGLDLRNVDVLTEGRPVVVNPAR